MLQAWKCRRLVDINSGFERQSRQNIHDGRASMFATSTPVAAPVRSGAARALLTFGAMPESPSREQINRRQRTMGSRLKAGVPSESQQLLRSQLSASGADQLAGSMLRSAAGAVRDQSSAQPFSSVVPAKAVTL